MNIDIVAHSEILTPYFKSLNLEWLEKYFKVEPIDLIMLDNPQAEIVDKGGFVFYATAPRELAVNPVGVVALIKISQDTFELAKMAVKPRFQNAGVGKRLLEHCIQTARNTGATRILLYSNRKLKPALALYGKYGFTESPMGHSEYERADIKMELLLHL